MTATRPPTLSRSNESVKARSNTFNSSFTSIRIAWKVRFAGCPPVRLARAGIAFFTISTSSKVVSIGLTCLSFSIILAIDFANFSSAYLYKIVTKS